MSSESLQALLKARSAKSSSSAASSSQGDDYSVIPSPVGDPGLDMVDSGGGLFEGESNYSSRKEYLSVLVENAAAVSGSKTQLLSPSNVPFSILRISHEMVENELVCGGVIVSTKSDVRPSVCVKSGCTVASHKVTKDVNFRGGMFYLAKGTKVVEEGSICLEVTESREDLLGFAIERMEEFNEVLSDAKTLSLEAAMEVFDQFKKEVSKECARMDVGKLYSGENLKSEKTKLTQNHMTATGPVVLEQIVKAMTSMQATLEKLEDDNTALKMDMERKTARLEKLEATDTAGLAGDVQTFDVRVRSLERSLEKLVDGKDTPLTNQDLSRLKLDIEELKQEIILLDSRSGSDPLKCGTTELRSLAETLMFVNDHLHTATYGDFFDLPALFDSIRPGDISSKDYVDTEHSAQKTKFLSIFEVSTAASFQRLIPVVFGGSGSNSVTSHSVSRLIYMKKREDWTSHGGTEGLKPALDAELDEQVVSITGRIRDSQGACLGGKVAEFYLGRSNLCRTSFFTWTEAFFMNLIGLSQGVSETEAWNLVLHCWLAFFKDLRRVRSPCANISVAGLDADCPIRKERVARYIWAMGQCIKVQDEYLEKGFRDHPTISSVINYHLFQYRVPLSVHQSAVQKLTEKIEALHTWKGQAVRDIAKLLKELEKQKK